MGFSTLIAPTEIEVYRIRDTPLFLFDFELDIASNLLDNGPVQHAHGPVLVGKYRVNKPFFIHTPEKEHDSPFSSIWHPGGAFTAEDIHKGKGPDYIEETGRDDSQEEYEAKVEALKARRNPE